MVLLAHDLRNPLSALLSNLEYLIGSFPSDDPELSEILADVSAAFDGLNNIIDNVDVLGLFYRGSQEVPFSDCGALGVLQQAQKSCAQIAASHRCELVSSIAPGTPTISIHTNAGMLGRALVNLIANSIQHAPSRPVELGLEVVQGNCRFTVVDRGPLLGANKETAFSLEGQLAAKSTTDGRYSRGFGLFAAQTAARAAGATLDCDVSAGQNRFILSLPVSSARGRSGRPKVGR